MDPFPTTYQRRRASRKASSSFYSQQSPSSPEKKGVSAEGITSSNAPTRANMKSRKRKTKKSKNKQSDDEVTIPQRIRIRGRAGRARDNCSTITNERGKLDSAKFLHYFMYIWRAFPEQKMNSVAYFDPLWFDLYANENYRTKVVEWIKAKGVFSKEYVFVPIVMWSHWSLLIFCHLGQSPDSKTNAPYMLLLDSMHSTGPTRLEPLARRLLLDMHKSEDRPESKEQLRKMRFSIPDVVPQQKKGDECGFYVLYFIKLFLESTPEDLDISDGYPCFMKRDWFCGEEVESFCQNLEDLPADLIDNGDDDDNDDDAAALVDSGDSIELIDNLFVDGKS